MKQRGRPMKTSTVELIREEVSSRDWTAEEFAKHLAGSTRLAEAILRGDMSMSPLMAARLSAAFGTSSELWMRLEKAQEAVRP